MSAVDHFVLYDNIQYTKKGWINRNRFLRNGSDVTFSLPLASAPEGLEIRERSIAEAFKRDKFLNTLRGAYHKAPFFDDVIALIERVIYQDERNLFKFLQGSLMETCRYIGLNREIIISSTIDIDHSLRSEERVIAICRQLKASTFINSIGGTGLYSHEAFRRSSLRLRFLKPDMFEYKQGSNSFVPWLSIIDVMMFTPPIQILRQLETGYQLQ